MLKNITLFMAAMMVLAPVAAFAADEAPARMTKGTKAYQKSGTESSEQSSAANQAGMPASAGEISQIEPAAGAEDNSAEAKDEPMHKEMRLPRKQN